MKKNKYGYCFYLLILVFLSSQFCFAADNPYSAWLGTFTKRHLGANYYSWVETQLRHSIESGSTNQILYRTGLLYKISETQEVGFLYAYIQGGNNKEHRFTVQHGQQYGKYLGLNFSHRLRFEARNLEDNDEDASRVRYLFRGEQKLNKFNFVFWNEFFFNLEARSWNGDRSFDRNRFFIGTNVQLGNVKGEFGYMNQYVPRKRGDTFEHIITLYFFF